jgi:hypothetical protein
MGLSAAFSSSGELLYAQVQLDALQVAVASTQVSPLLPLEVHIAAWSDLSFKSFSPS